MQPETYSRHRWARTAVALSMVFLAGGAASLRGQDASASKASERSERGLCWWGRPHSDCRNFLISEFSAHSRVIVPHQTVLYAAPWDSSPKPTKVRVFRGVLGFEAGVMRNVARRSAVGLSASVAVLEGDLGSRQLVASKVRYRFWMSPNGAAIDVGAGLESREFQLPGTRRRHIGFTSDLAVNAADYAALFVRYDQLRMVGTTKPALSLGVRAGAQIGFFGALGTALTAAFIYLGMKDALK